MAKINRRVLLANDLSELSDESESARLVEQVENCALSLSQLFDLPIGYVSVSGVLDLDVSQPERVIEDRRGRIAARLSRFKIKPEVILRFGSPTDEIVQLINEKETLTEMAVLGTRGRVGLQHIWEGSVAEDVIRDSSRPVVVVGPSVKGDGRLGESPKLIVATDFGEPAQAAEKYAIKMAKELGLDIKLLFCLGDELRAIQETILNTGVAPYDFQSREKQLREQIQRDLDKKVERVKKMGVRITAEIRRGLAVDELPIASKTCNLLVTGTRGHNRLLTTFFGSTARAAILTSAAPVMVVPLMQIE